MDAGGERRRDHQRDEGARAELEQEQLDRQDHAGDGRVERRGHAGAGSASEQHLALGGRGGNDLADDRAERAAGLNDRPFGAERAARTDRDGRRKRLENGDFRFDAAARDEYRFHRFRNAVAFDFRRAVLHHQADDQTADHRHEDHPRPQLVRFRAAKAKRPDVIEREVGEKADEIVKDESDQSRRKPDARCQQGDQTHSISRRGLRRQGVQKSFRRTQLDLLSRRWTV